MSEMAVSADQIVVIGRGHFITQGSVDDLTRTAQGSVLVRSASPDVLKTALSQATEIETLNDGALNVTGLSAEAIGTVALSAGIALSELTPQRASLEEVFMELTADSLDYGSHSKGDSK